MNLVEIFSSINFSVAHDLLVATERKAHAMQNALEETRALLEQGDRNRRALEQELSDTNEVRYM